MKRFCAELLSVSLWSPGLEGWAASQAVLAGREPYVWRDSTLAAPTILPPNERRRAGEVVRLALNVAQGAAEGSGMAPETLRCVFGSANGDGPVMGSILGALAQAAPGSGHIVSPTQFHNSVHNAAAAYWSIATGNTQPATCIACHDFTWASAFLHAMLEVDAGAPVLLCVYDHPLPPAYARKRSILAPFGVGLVLVPYGGGGFARVTAVHETDTAEHVAPETESLAVLANGNPAAQSLRLLQHLARRTSGRCDAPYFDGRLQLEVSPL